MVYTCSAWLSGFLVLCVVYWRYMMIRFRCIVPCMRLLSLSIHCAHVVVMDTTSVHRLTTNEGMNERTHEVRQRKTDRPHNKRRRRNIHRKTRKADSDNCRATER